MRILFSGNKGRTLACALAIMLTAFTLPAVHAQAIGSESFPVGGNHEIGGYVGHSWNAGPALGYVRNTKFTSIVGRYSYSLRRNDIWDLRWAPEVTLLGNLYEPAPSSINPNVPQRDLGAGLTPAAFQGVFLPKHHIQPYVNAEGGFIWYNKVVLVPGATSFMFLADIGAGVNVFISKRNAVQTGFKYLHQSNANSATRNPGTDAELFYVGYSHFFSKHHK